MYSGYYLCRKNFSILMPFLKTEQGYDSESLAHVLFFYSCAYAAGQFVMGQLADRWGARLVVTLGAAGSAAMSALAVTPVPLVASQGANGLMQASGWPGVLKMSREWFPDANRGVIMAWWGTHLVAGGFLSTNLAAAVAEGGWQRTAWVPSLVLVAIALVFGLLSRDGTPRVRGSLEPRATNGPLPLRPPLVCIAVMYFFVKMTRYSFLFWLPLYMTERLSYSPQQAGFASSAFEVIGFLGVLLAGYCSEKVTPGRRFPVGAAMMAGLALMCVLYPWLSRYGAAWNVAAIALLGGFTFGPDTLMAGPGTQEAAPSEAVARAAGFVNGVGSIGQVVSPYFVAVISTHFGWDAMFYSLGVAALLGSAVLTTQWSHH
jgi:sugar phosphate permease